MWEEIEGYSSVGKGCDLILKVGIVIIKAKGGDCTDTEGSVLGGEGKGRRVEFIRL